MNATGSDKSGKRDSIGGHVAIRQDDDTNAIGDRSAGFVAYAVQSGLVTGETFGLVKGDVDDARGPVGVNVGETLERVCLFDGKDRGREEKTVALRWLHREQVALGANVAFERHDDRLSNRVDRRVGDLGEELTEVVVDETRLRRHARQRSVVAHTAQRLFAIGDHGSHEQVELLEGEAESEKLRIGRHGRVVELDIETSSLGSLARHDVRKLKHLRVNPVGEGSTRCRPHLEFAIVDDSAFDRVHQ